MLIKPVLSRYLSAVIILNSLFLPYNTFAGKGEIVYDVSGRHGEADRDGTSYSGSAGSGSGYGGDGHDGADGGDAHENPLQDGQAAGELVLNISYVDPNSGKQIGIQGDKIEPGYQAKKSINDTFDLSRDLRIQALAVGGKGGRGGHGGRGQDGGDGARGKDAYHSGHTPVSGTDGGDGGDGGNEGDSTSGGDAGDGGNIDVRVSIRETDLAMLLEKVSVNGNVGGARGEGKGVGSGGSGGSGGSSDSISWQEKTGTRPVYSSRPIRNSQGETIGSEEYKSGEEDVFTTRSSYASGGSSGSSGSSGRHSSKTVYDGKDSKAGKFRYIVVDEEGKETAYPAPYDLVLQPGYKLTGDLNDNGFFEPGETIHVTNLKVTNSGQAPTPKYQKIILYISDNQKWIRSKSVELSIPLVLAPGESYTFAKEEIPFYLAEIPRTQPGALDSGDTLAPRARVERVERDFRNYNSQSTTDFKVRYPIEITSLYGLDNLAAGEFGKVMFKVKNISNQTIGEVDGKKLRKAHIRLRRNGGDTEKDQFLILQTPEGQKVETDKGFDLPLEGLKPGEEMIVEAIVGLGKSPTAYSEVEIYPELHLESNLKGAEDQGNLNRIQYNPFVLRVSQVFKHSPDADILLVANSSLDDAALDAFRLTAQIKNLKMDIWDFSYYGFFNLHQSIQGWNSFFAAYRNKTIFILGNEVNTPAGDQRVQSILSPDEVIEAARRWGIRVVILDTSSESNKILENLITPTARSNQSSDGEDSIRNSSIDAYLKDLKAEVHRLDEEIAGDEKVFLGLNAIGISKWQFWGKPKQEALLKQADVLLNRARRVAPEASLFIDYVFEPQKTGGFFSKWKLGELRVRRSVDTSLTSVAVLNVTQKQINDPNYIMSREFQSLFDMGMHIDAKLKILQKILSGTFVSETEEFSNEFKVEKTDPLAIAQFLIQTLMSEIIHEQLQVRPLNFKSELSKEQIYNKLDLLQRVANYKFDGVELDPKSPEGKMWVSFISQLSFFSDGVVTRWEKIYSGVLGWLGVKSKNLETSEVTAEFLNRLVENIFSVDTITEARTEIEKQILELKEKRKKSKAKKEDISGMLLEGQNSNNGLIANTSVGIEAKNRLRNSKDQAESEELETLREKQALKVHSAIVGKNAELKLQASMCDEILNRK